MGQRGKGRHDIKHSTREASLSHASNDPSSLNNIYSSYSLVSQFSHRLARGRVRLNSDYGRAHDFLNLQFVWVVPVQIFRKLGAKRDLERAEARLSA
jgi:hypothetical protein